MLNIIEAWQRYHNIGTLRCGIPRSYITFNFSQQPVSKSNQRRIILAAWQINKIVPAPIEHHRFEQRL